MKTLQSVTRLLVLAFLSSTAAQQTAQQKDFIIECIRPLGIRVTPSPDFRIIQTGCRGPDTNVALEEPYDVSPDCLVVTETGTAVQIVLELSTSTRDLVGGFSSRVFLVSCNFPGSKGYKDTFNRDIEAIKQPEGIDPTATSGVFKFTGVLMSIIDKASFTARQWAVHLAANAFIGQELYLTISHPQRDEGQAFIIPRECRVKPNTGNFTKIWYHNSTQERCLEVNGISRNLVRVFSDVSSATDVMSLQFYGFQFLGHEEEVITFECDVLLCGDITTGSCGEEWTKLTVDKVCMTNKPPPLPRPVPTDPPGKVRRRRRSQVNDLHHGIDSISNNNNNNNNNISSPFFHCHNSSSSSSRDTDSNGNITAFSGINSSSSTMSNNNSDNTNSNDRIGTPLASGQLGQPTGSSDTLYSSNRAVVQEETVRVEIRMSMPRAKLTHMGSGSRIFPSAIVALLLTVTVQIFSEG